jgi:hypothetical protein
VDLVPSEVIGLFSCTMALKSTQHLTEMNIRNVSGG